MKKLMGILFFLGVVAMAKDVQAAASVRAPKSYTTINYSTTPSSVTVSGAGVVYGVILSTGTAGTDYMALFDSASIGTLVANATTFKVRVNISSTTQNTVVTFDPPLQFTSGIIAALSAATSWGTVIYERGRAASTP